MSNDLIVPDSGDAQAFPSLHVVQFTQHQPVPSSFLNAVQNSIYRLDSGKHNRNGDEDHYGIFAVHTSPRPASLDVVRKVDLEALAANTPVPVQGSYLSLRTVAAISFDFSSNRVVSSNFLGNYFEVVGSNIRALKKCLVLVLAKCIHTTNTHTGTWSVDSSLKLQVNNMDVEIARGFFGTDSNGALNLTMSFDLFSIVPLNATDVMSLVETNLSWNASQKISSSVVVYVLS